MIVEHSDVASHPAQASSPYQHAVRILACIVAAADPNPIPDWEPDVVGVLRSQSRLQAMDFWMRNPDYLADELLTEYEHDGDPSWLKEAEAIIGSREPDLRRLPMVRYCFGAFEPLDNTLSILLSAGLIRIERKGNPNTRIREHFYFLLDKGKAAMSELASLHDDLAWYQRRAELVAKIAGGVGGRALKDRQYLQQTYADTDLGEIIAPLGPKVEARLVRLKEERA